MVVNLILRHKVSSQVLPLLKMKFLLQLLLLLLLLCPRRIHLQEIQKVLLQLQQVVKMRQTQQQAQQLKQTLDRR